MTVTESGVQRSPMGKFVAVVGPSGAGKDTLISAAKQILSDSAIYHYPRRIITRQANAADEDHDCVDPHTFNEMEAGRQFSLSWSAHGLKYALPLSLESAMAAGHVIVANLSRSVLDEARARYKTIIILEVRARPDILLQRLRARGRESQEDIEGRIRRAIEMRADDGVRIVENNGLLRDAVRDFVKELKEIAAV